MFLHRQFSLANVSDFTLLDHVINKTDVADEFECQLECIGNNSCKSFNVHRNGNNTKKLCELNNITRQIKPGDFKRKKGSTCYDSVQIGLKYVSGVQAYSSLFERGIRRR